MTVTNYPPQSTAPADAELEFGVLIDPESGGSHAVAVERLDQGVFLVALDLTRPSNEIILHGDLILRLNQSATETKVRVCVPTREDLQRHYALKNRLLREDFAQSPGDSLVVFRLEEQPHYKPVEELTTRSNEGAEVVIIQVIDPEDFTEHCAATSAFPGEFRDDEVGITIRRLRDSERSVRFTSAFRSGLDKRIAQVMAEQSSTEPVELVIIDMRRATVDERKPV